MAILSRLLFLSCCDIGKHTNISSDVTNKTALGNHVA